VVPFVDNGDSSSGAGALVAEGLVSIEDARRFLGGISRSFIYSLMERGQLVWTMCGKRRLIPRRALVAFAASQLRGGWAGNADGVELPRGHERVAEVNDHHAAQTFTAHGAQEPALRRAVCKSRD
jgi:hypothetical protein